MPDDPVSSLEQSSGSNSCVEAGTGRPFSRFLTPSVSKACDTGAWGPSLLCSGSPGDERDHRVGSVGVILGEADGGVEALTDGATCSASLVGPRSSSAFAEAISGWKFRV